MRVLLDECGDRVIGLDPEKPEVDESAESCESGAAEQANGVMRQTITVDFSHDPDLLRLGIGLIIQETEKRGEGRRGPIVDSVSICLPDKGLQGAKLAILTALELAKTRGYRDVTIRSNHNPIRRKYKRAIEKEDVGDGRLQPLDLEILSLAANFDRIRFGYFPSRKNRNARDLARKGRDQLEASPPRSRPKRQDTWNEDE